MATLAFQTAREAPVEGEQPLKLAALARALSASTTCSRGGDSDSSPGASPPHQAASKWDDEEEEAKSPVSNAEARVWSKSTTCSSDVGEDFAQSREEDDEVEEKHEGEAQESSDPGERHTPEYGLPTAPESDDAIAKKLTSMGQAGIVAALGRIMSQLASLGHRPHRPTMFHATRPPPISIQDYLARIAQYYNCSDACLILGLVYIDRALKSHPQLVVSPLSVHRLLAVGVMLAAKFHDDVYYANAHYGKVAGMSLQEMNKLEESFLGMLKWRLMVQPREYEMIVDHVLRAASVSPQ